MWNILGLLLLSAGFAFLLTPLVGRIGKYYGFVDKPSGRKVHKIPLPRIGGVAIFLAFHLSFLAMTALSTESRNLITSRLSLFWLLGGSTVVFLMGFMDDIQRLTPRIKFAIQGVAAAMAYAAGLRISVIQLPWDSTLSLGWLSFPTTVFWVLLVVNAINLTDGLDGLAAGISLFASLLLLALSVLGKNHVVAMGLAAVAGSCAGFLRYNFNPASIFMGDCGSYFLGYMLASLSVLGSIKSQTTVAILIPFIALGLPLMDTLLAPIRRFCLGQKLFQPDRSHVHHKLLQMGFSQRKAVLVMYFITICLGLFSLMIVNMRNEQTAFLLLTLGICVIWGIHKLGYLGYIGPDKMIGYIHDVSDEMGFNRDRRTFLNHQIAISEAMNSEEMWRRIVEALIPLQIDHAELHFNEDFCVSPSRCHYTWSLRELREDPAKWCHHLLSIELPLADEKQSYGTLFLKKDIIADPISHYTLRRIEHLRRSIVGKLSTFKEKSNVKQSILRNQKTTDLSKSMTRT